MPDVADATSTARPDRLLAGLGRILGVSGELYIARLAPQPGHPPGWRVMIPMPPQLVQEGHQAFLRRSFCRGPLADSLAQAVVWRDRWHQRLYGRSVPARVFHRTQRNGTTGVPGVTRLVKRVKRRGCADQFSEVPVYMATVWTQPPQAAGQNSRGSRSRLYSIGKYGEEMAFAMACAWRREAEERLARGETIEPLAPHQRAHATKAR